MGLAPNTRRLMVRETLLALLVLALTLLNFGHASAVSAAGGRVVVDAVDVCGDPTAPNVGEHFACHACRPVLADLPPPPCGIEPVAFVVTPVVYAGLGDTIFAPVPGLPWSARAPPLA